MKPLILFLTSLLVLIVTLPGCQQPQPAPQQLEQGLVYMFPGIEGGYWSLGEARRGFRNGGLKSAILTHEWNHPISPFQNLMDYQGNLQAARKVARKIGQYRREYPDTPIDLVGYSGGGGVAILVAQALSPEVQLRNIVLVHAAISCDYDLTEALNHVEGKLVNVYSDLDWFMLGVGTSVFGTIDRKNAPAAGMKGFKLENAVNKNGHLAKVEQLGWELKHLPDGRWGGHFGIHFYHFNKNFIAPYLVE